MEQRLYQLVQQCTIKLLPDRSDWGTGFFVAKETILTCAHVVAGYENKPISLQWQGQDIGTAKVVKFIPEPIDLALLYCHELSSLESHPPCAILDIEFQPFHDLYIYGYPDDFPEGAGVTVQCEGNAIDRGVKLIKFQAGQIRPGHSGSPVFNEKTSKVCGVVSDTRGRSTNLGGLAIAVAEAIENFPKLQSKNQLFHSLTQPNPLAEKKVIEILNQCTGRDELLRQLFEELDKGSNKSLIGSTRMGKSWLLQQVHQYWKTRIQRQIDGCLLLDMQLIEDGREFFEVLCQEIGIQSSLRKHDINRELKNKRYILCLDEIDMLTDENRFQEADRRFLRALSDGADKPFSLVIASQRPLRELFPDSPTHSSPLADICTPIHINQITLEQTRAFIETCGISINETHLKQLWHDSKGQPKTLLDKVAEIYKS